MSVLVGAVTVGSSVASSGRRWWPLSSGIGHRRGRLHPSGQFVVQRPAVEVEEVLRNYVPVTN
ncbi:MAG TPA: hypothetical protein VM143_17800 [Acidimicrobiales bacterium]|nr:hypothetical protein [Acidimicrobiales bacterium]